MRTQPMRRAGQPLYMLAMLLALWAFVRVSVWESPLPGAGRPVLARAPAPGHAPVERTGAMLEAPVPDAVVWPNRGIVRRTRAVEPKRPPGMFAALAPPSQLLMPPSNSVPINVAPLQRPAPAAHSQAEPSGSPPRASQALPTASISLPMERWSLDSWVFLRPAAGRAAVAGVLPASYGRGQAGAMLRYRIDTAGAHRPEAFLLATATPATFAEPMIAAGVSARVLPRVPVRARAELRLAHRDSVLRPAPAAMLVSEAQPLALPGGLTAESYAAAGYVGGTFATPFAEGQARLTRKLTQVAGRDLRLGAGAWGGAQEGAARLDVGPTTSLDLPLGEGSARLSLDYRIRVAGNAAPGSGVALTLSTGF